MGHYLLLATLDNEGGTSLSARKRAGELLANDPSFIGGGTPDNGYFFYHPLADYFLIGGSFSGHLDGIEHPCDWNDDGRECDAQLITEALYDQFLVPFERYGTPEVTYVDLEHQELGRDFIGRKWIVVVDFHQ